MKFYLTLLRHEGKRLPEQPVPENARTLWLEFAQLVDTVRRQDARWPTSFEQLTHIVATYPSLERFLTELTLDPPDASDQAGIPLLGEDYTYKCVVSKTGCRSSDSCHLGGAGSVCCCYGPECIDIGDQVSGTDVYQNRVRGDKSGSYSEGVNNSCYLLVHRPLRLRLGLEWRTA